VIVLANCQELDEVQQIKNILYDFAEDSILLTNTPQDFIVKDAFTSKIYPIPFSTELKIQYDLAEANWVEINIYDQFGRLIKNLISDNQGSGLVEINWNGNDNKNVAVRKGVYILSFKVGDQSINRKILRR